MIPGNSDIDWTDRGPRSRRFDDIYFSPEDGLGESRAVFLGGCGLPQGWAGRRRFVVGELGFGTGLNVAALIDLWRRAGPADGRLHVFSVEGFPLSAQDAGSALSAWPELSEVAGRLLAAWPDARRGLHRIEFRDWRVTLDLAVADVVPALEGWEGRADAWFLDGFAPARNPAMWTPQVLAMLAERSAPGARLASFTVAGAVRAGLAAAGLAVERRPGFGRKRERLEARAPGEAAPEPALARVAVIGAGVAGAALARAFAALGVRATVIEAAHAGAGASGNPAALVSPRLDAGLGPAAALYAQAFARAVRLYLGEAPGAVIARGALQLERAPRDAGRFDKLARWDGFGSGALARLDAEAVAARLGEPVSAAALAFRDALVVEPAAVLDAWLRGAERVDARADRLERIAEGWAVVGEGGVVCEAEAVVLAAGIDAAGLHPGLPLRAVRGQVSWTAASWTAATETAAEGNIPGEAAAWSGYAIPTRGGVLFGATHDRDDTSRELRPGDHAHNRALLAQGRPALAAALAAAPLHGRAAVRAATPDHLPLAGGFLAGGVGPGLFALSGLGGRGFTLAPLLAEHVAALATGAPSPLPGTLAAAVDPGRFAG